jgi:hypothetical protein
VKAKAKAQARAAAHAPAPTPAALKRPAGNGSLCNMFKKAKLAKDAIATALTASHEA